MATYIPNATQTTEPVESRTVESAALEFRTLKTSITARIEDVQDNLDTEIVNRIAGDANLQEQNNAQDVRLTAIENALPFIGEGAVPGTVYVQRFSGTGAQTAFTLDVVPHAGNVVDIYVNGLYQNKDTFSVAGAVITFSEAPPAGTDNIEVQVTVTIALGETDASLVTYGATTVEAQLDSISAASGSSLVGFQQAGTGAVVRTSQDKMREWVSVKDFGAVGDGVANDTAEIQAALAYLTSVGGGELTFGKGETYLVTDELSVTDSVEVDLNGSTINFAAIGGKRLLSIQGSNVQVRNGTVNNTLNQVGFEGTLQTPIVIGKYTQLAGYANVVLENLTVSTAVNQGNGIAIFGDSHDIVVQNITFPDSDKIGIPVLAHWSFDEAFNTGPTYTGVTTHPHNLTINNIKCGDLTYSGGGVTGFGKACVFLSACYNVTVSNVYVKSFPFGQICTVYAGDWGFKFGTATEQSLGSAGISISNLYGKALVAVDTYMQNSLQGPSVIWPSSIVIDNVAVVGYGDTNPQSKGLRIDFTTNVIASNIVTSNAYHGVFVGSGSDLKITNCTFKNSRRQGILKFGAGASSNVNIENNNFVDNNLDDAAATADITLVSMSNVKVKNNVFNSPSAIWSLQASNTVTNLRVVDNHVVNVNPSFGPCFSFGSQADTNICIEFEGNTFAVSPASGIRGGQFMVPMVFSARHSQNTLQRVAYYSAVPDRGTWSVGDRVFNDNPVIGQPKSWVCTVAGTPGTWVSEGNL